MIDFLLPWYYIGSLTSSRFHGSNTKEKVEKTQICLQTIRFPWDFPWFSGPAFWLVDDTSQIFLARTGTSSTSTAGNLVPKLKGGNLPVKPPYLPVKTMVSCSCLLHHLRKWMKVVVNIFLFSIQKAKNLKVLVLFKTKKPRWTAEE